jgi:hypothetical protein
MKIVCECGSEEQLSTDMSKFKINCMHYPEGVGNFEIVCLLCGKRTEKITVA